MTKDIVEYTAKPVDDVFVQFHSYYKLQCIKDKLQKRLDMVDAEMAKLLKSIDGKHSDVFAFVDMRNVRKIEAKHIEWIKQNLPDVYKKTISLSNTDVGKFLLNLRGREAVNNMVELSDEAYFREHAKINITDFDKAVGGKVAAERFDGLAFQKDFYTKAGSRLSIIKPSEHPELLRLMEEEDVS